MFSFLIGFLTFALIGVSSLLVLVVLMQKTKDGGMGAALGGGATESAFGHETGNVLSKATIYAAIAFFVLSFALYLGRIYEKNHPSSAGGVQLEKMAVPAATAPVLPTTSVSSPTTGTTSAAAGGAASAASVTLPLAPATSTTPPTPPAPDAAKPTAETSKATTP